MELLKVDALSGRLRDIKITGWVQPYTGDLSSVSEIVQLNIEIGMCVKQSIDLDCTGDELVQWCKHHGHACKDYREPNNA